MIPFNDIGRELQMTRSEMLSLIIGYFIPCRSGKAAIAP